MLQFALNLLPLPFFSYRENVKVPTTLKIKKKKKRNDTCSFLLYIAFNSVCERRNTDDHEPNCGFAKCIKKEKLFFRFRYPPPSLPSSVNSRSAQQGYIVRSHQRLVSADTMRANRRKGGGGQAATRVTETAILRCISYCCYEHFAYF